MPTITGTNGDDRLIAAASGDQVFGLDGDDRLIAAAPNVELNGDGGDDRLSQNLQISDIASFDTSSVFRAGAGDDRVILQTNVEAGGAFDPSVQPLLSVDQEILTEGGDDFTFIRNQLVVPFDGADIITIARARTSLIDLIGDNVVTIRNVISTVIGFAEAVTNVALGIGNDVVRYVGDTTDFNSNAQSTHFFDLGDGNNRLTYDDTTLGLNLDVVSGSGRDVINIDYQIEDPNTFFPGAQINILTGGGDDVVTVNLRGDSGINQQAASFIDLGDGDNFLRMSQDITGSISVVAGDGDDRFDLTTLGSEGFFGPEGPFDINVDLGDGNNRVTVDLEVGETIGQTSFSLVTGDGRDRIDFNASVEVDPFFGVSDNPFAAQIDTGAGNDQINIGFADLSLTTGTGADIVRFDQAAITEPQFDDDTGLLLNPGQNSLILTDLDFKAGDRFIFTGFDSDETNVTLRSVADIEAMATSGGAVALTELGDNLVLQVANADGVIAQILFEGLAETDTFAFL